jgi:tetratricopeptide (TPR) repeat protein
VQKKGLSRKQRRKIVGKTRRRPLTSEDEVRREEALRPSPDLGYDRARIALHLIEREAYAIAETELRRAIWLNPYEPAFKLHLAFCLYREKRLEEAREALLPLAGEEQCRKEREELLTLIEGKLRR